MAAAAAVSWWLLGRARRRAGEAQDRSRLAAPPAAAAVQAPPPAAQRDEAVGRVAGGIAQECNHLLTTLLSTAELSGQGLAANDPLRDDLAGMRQSARRALELLRSLLAFARRQRLEPVDLDLDAVVGELFPLLERGLPEQCKLLRGPRAGGWVRADRFELEQALVDLCLGAAGAMPEGGAITLATSIEAVDPDWCSAHPWATPGRYVVLAVSDPGEGPGRQPGLAAARAILGRRGGGVEVEGAHGKGSTSRLYLRQVEGPPTEPKPEPRAEAGRGERILVVDDNRKLRRNVLRALSASGYRVFEAESGQEALRLLEKESVDLIVTDAVMPGLSGASLLEQVRRRDAKLPFLLCSGDDEEIARGGALPAGNAAFVAKPFDLRLLLGQVRKLLDERREEPA